MTLELVESIGHRLAHLVTACFIAACPMFAQGPPPTGQIRGTVQTVDGKPVANALVMINIQPGAGAKPFSTRATTGGDGVFFAPAMPDGTFQVCPQLPGSDLLAPCSWDLNPPTATLSGGRSVTLAAIQMKAGVHLKIRLDDLTGKRAAMEGKVDGASVYVHVRRRGGLSMPVSIVKADLTGHDHEVVVPFDTSLEVAVSSKLFAIADDKGKPVDKTTGAIVPIQVPTGTTPPTILFKVTGVN